MSLQGCASPQADALRPAAAAAQLGVAPAREIAGVPFYEQERDQCGPATLAMALSASGPALTPEALRDMVFVPGRAGSLGTEMLAAARREGRLAVALEPALGAVLREVDAGNPVIVLQNLGLSIYPVWHYALVIGYDLPQDRMLMHSGPQARATMSLELFERTWARSGYWAMVATDPGNLPVTPPEAALLDASAALERVDPRAARQAYGALLRRPAHSRETGFGASMGLGNSAFAAGDTAAAAAAFAAASELQPDSGDAWNNLASVRAALGDRDGARAAIGRALALGGPHRALYEQTAAEIAAAR